MGPWNTTPEGRPSHAEAQWRDRRSSTHLPLRGSVGLASLGTVFQKLDDRLNHPETREAILLRLQGGMSLLESMRAGQDANEPNQFLDRQIAHIADHWLPADRASGDGDGWFDTPRQQKNAILKAAYIKAINLADEVTPAKKIRSCWLCDGGNRFQAAVLGGEQVTVLILTPHNANTKRMHAELAETDARGELPNLEEIWIFGNDQRLRDAMTRAREVVRPGDIDQIPEPNDDPERVYEFQRRYNDEDVAVGGGGPTQSS